VRFVEMKIQKLAGEYVTRALQKRVILFLLRESWREKSSGFSLLLVIAVYAQRFHILAN
jgi:hypothetical protein